MGHLRTLSQEDIDGSTVPELARANFFHRESVRAVFIDGVGAVALLHSTKRSYLKLPGGGIEEGEDRATALYRELLEETGCKSHIICELGRVVEYRDFVCMEQTSDCYIAQVEGQKGAPSYTEDEISEGFELVWAPNINEALRLVRGVDPLNDLQIKFMRQRELVILEAAQEVLARGIEHA